MKKEHNFKKKSFQLIAKTFFGLEKVLAEELRELGAEQVKIANRAVSFEADQTLMYEANLWLRTAVRILKPIHQFKVRNEHQLYKQIKMMDWTKYIGVEDTFAIDTVVKSDFFNHTKYVALKAKDAIVDQFRESTGKRPSVDVETPTLRINLHLIDDVCSVALDSSGDSLHKRGYRVRANQAPLKEVLGAGLIKLSAWKADRHFVDPMCGSGTLLIEAGLIAHNIAPGLLREQFGFMTWRDYDASLWHQLKEEAKLAQREFDFRIIGSDLNPRTVEVARENIEKAGLDETVIVSHKDFKERIPPKGEGTLVMNPPYGERMKEAEIDQFYKMMGDQFKQHYAGYDAWILTSNKEALKRVGLRPSRKFTVFNGSLECKLYKYEMYRGRKG